MFDCIDTKLMVDDYVKASILQQFPQQKKQNYPTWLNEKRPIIIMIDLNQDDRSKYYRSVHIRKL